MNDFITGAEKKSPSRSDDDLERLQAALGKGLDDLEKGRTLTLDEAMQRLQKELQAPSI